MVVARNEGGMRFVITTGSGHDILVDDGERDSGARPTEALIASLAGCTGMDVGSLLTKKRQQVSSYRVEATAGQRETYPRVFTTIDLVHVVEGAGIDVVAVRRSIELSATKYCPISAMISAGPTAIHHRYRIVDTAHEPPLVTEDEVLVTGPNQPLLA
jgi:putative redox protein